jgi:hypothetical protein
MEKHYICMGGCGGSAKVAGVCQTEGCADYGKQLRECACADGFHGQGTEQEQEGGE